MSVKIWMGDSPLENSGEAEMVSSVIACLKERLGPLDEEFHILCGFSIPGFPRKGMKAYRSHLDMAVLKSRQLVILELKNYRGTLGYASSGEWICHTEQGDIPVMGGREGRTPERQVREYREQMAAFLANRRSDFLSKHLDLERFFKFISCLVLFPDFKGEGVDDPDFKREDSGWMKVVRLKDLCETLLQRAGGRGVELDGYEVSRLISNLFLMREATLVGGMPALVKPSSPQPAGITPPVKVVHVPFETVKVVEKPVYIRGEYDQIEQIFSDECPRDEKILQFGQIFRSSIWKKVKERYPETSIRYDYSAITHLFRGEDELFGYASRFWGLFRKVSKNRRLSLSQADLEESYKTLCLVVSFLFKQPIPAALAERCEKIAYRGRRRQESGEEGERILFLRLGVTDIDPANRCFRGVDTQSDGGKEYTICYTDGEDAFKEFHRLISPGDIVGGLYPVERGEVWGCSALVLEPDFLLSPQQIGKASVFRKGAIYYWLDMIRDDGERLYRPVSGKSPLTLLDYILLGNFSNECLAGYAAGDPREPLQRIRSFTAENILDMASTDSSREWVDACITSDRNIKEVIEKVLPRDYAVHPGEWQIEGPIISPFYGLSARADAICRDLELKKATVFELKSGKWDSYRNSPRGEHLCQPNFYTDLLFLVNGIRRRSVNSLLYYSKDLPASRSGKLFAQEGGQRAIQSALMLRNQIVWTLKSMQRGNFRRFISRLTPEDFRADSSGEKLWSEYKRPEIEALLKPLQSSPPLALDYFYRQLKFLADEGFAPFSGESREGRNRLPLWLQPRSARACDGIELQELACIGCGRDGLGRLVSLTLDLLHCETNKNCSIRKGDSVYLYRESEEQSDIAHAVLFAASVEELTSRQVKIRLDDPQSEKLFSLDENPRFTLSPYPDHMGGEGYKGLWHFLTGDPRRRGLILNTVEPEVDPKAELPRSDSQNRYPKLLPLLRDAWRAKDWYLIWGPPGTGKTSHAMRALVDQAMAVPGMRVLLLSYTYKATDNICEMLEERLASGESGPYLRLGNPMKCGGRGRDRLIANLNLKNTRQLRDRVEACRIVVAPVMALKPSSALFHLGVHFDLAIVDEASQLLDTHMLPLFCAKAPGGKGPLVGKFILIGDDLQLPAVVQQDAETSRVREPTLRDQGIVDCRESLFSRLRKVAASRPGLCGMLDRQFRMHPMISDFTRGFFYKGRLRDGDAVHQRVNDLPGAEDGTSPFDSFVLGHRIGFFPVTDHESTGVKVSEGEAGLCAEILRVLLGRPARPASGEGESPRPYEPGEVGIIVTFRCQISRIREKIGTLLGTEIADGIPIDTVERFQGSDRPVILFSTVIAQSYQGEMIGAVRYGEEDRGEEIDRKLNVAITRAKERFYLVGHENALRGLRAYGDLLQWISDHESIFDPERMA